MSGPAEDVAIDAAHDDLAEVAAAMIELIERLYPHHRSVTGDGVRRTLDAVAALAPGLERREVPSGTPILDWTAPPEWRVREAWLAAPDGERRFDWRDHPLRLLGCSAPVRTRLPLAELRAHLHVHPDRDDAIPYRTSPWQRDWGFCLTRREFEAMPDGVWEVCIDSDLDENGSLSYGELLLPATAPARTDADEPGEVLVSTHVCHPGMANDNLSGIAVATYLARALATRERRWSYRFLFVPGTVGAIAWLAANRDAASRIRHGLVVTGLGDPGPLHYKRSRREDAPIDRAAAHLLAARPGARVLPFAPWGYDERQYGSPGFDLPVGRLSRTPHGEYPEYHSSDDDLSLIAPERLAGALAFCLELFAVLETDRRYRNLAPYGEPQLGRRGLYRALGGLAADDAQLATLWLLNQSDGTRSLLDVAERSGLPFGLLRRTATLLERHGLLQEVIP